MSAGISRTGNALRTILDAAERLKTYRMKPFQPLAEIIEAAQDFEE